eukprot:UN02523
MVDFLPSMFNKDFNSFKKQASKKGISVVTMPGQDAITFPKKGLVVAVFFTDLRRAVPGTTLNTRLPYCVHMNINGVDSSMCDEDLPILSMANPESSSTTTNQLSQIVSLSQEQITVQLGLKFSYDPDYDDDNYTTGDMTVKLNHFIVPQVGPVDLRATAEPTSCSIVAYNAVSPTQPAPTNWKFNVEFKTRKVNDTIVDPFTTGYLYITGEAPAPSTALLTCTWPILSGKKANPSTTSGSDIPAMIFKVYQPSNQPNSYGRNWATEIVLPLKDAKQLDKTNWNTFTPQTCTYALMVTPSQPLTSPTQLATLKQTVLNILNTDFAIYDNQMVEKPFGTLTVDDLLLPSGPGYDYPQDYWPGFARFSSFDTLMTTSRRLGDTNEELQQPYPQTIVFLLTANKAPTQYPVEYQTRKAFRWYTCYTNSY